MSKLCANIFLIPTRYVKLLMVLRVFKVDCFVLELFLAPNLRSEAQIELKKHPCIVFPTFGSKINEFERKKLEINEKIQRPISCMQLPQCLIHSVFQICHMENQNNKLLLLRIISSSKYVEDIKEIFVLNLLIYIHCDLPQPWTL